jgi:hypothetical protein
MDSNTIIVVATFLAVLFVVLFVVFATDVIRTKKPKEDLALNLLGNVSNRNLLEKQLAQADHISPFWPRHLVDLFVRPREFFAGQLALGNTPSFLLVTWSYGVAVALDQVHRDLVRKMKSPGNLVAMGEGSWFEFWSWILTIGAIGGFVLWWLGGWWFSVRLRWSGAKELSERSAHLLYVYSSFVVSAPTIAAALFWTATEPNYRQAVAAARPYLAALLIFPFWSLVTSYIGARTLFQVNPWKARLWLIIIPAGFYLLPLALVAAALLAR